MSALESLRKRSGLLVTIVGLALFAFVLTGLFERGSMGDSDKSVGEIAGKSIDYNTFNVKVQEALENKKRNSEKTVLDENEIDGVIQQVWNQAINEEVMNKEYEKLGISVSDEELYDLMIDHPHSALVRNLSDPQTNQVSPMFADPKTGQVSPAKLKEFTQKMNPEQEKQWIQLESYIRQMRIIEKYNNLIKKGLYVTTAAAKRDYIAQNTNADIQYVTKNFKLVADSTIKVEDADLNTYYAAHQNEFKQETSRKIEYVAFDITPSQEDKDEALDGMKALATTFKASKPSEDSLFVIAESDTRLFDISFHGKGTLSPEIDSIMFNSAVGTVVGPYKENEILKVSKLIAIKSAADSAKVRHILIAYAGSGASESVTRSKEQAKTTSDSLLALLKKGAKFSELVDKLSDDGGKNMPPNKKEGEYYPGKGGDYGWLNPNSQFVEPFKNAGLDNKKGAIVIAESQFGYHIIEVLDTKGSQKKVQVATIERKLEPSNKTMQAAFLKASEFAGKNNTDELFQKAVVENKLNKRVVESIKENDKTIAGIESPRPLIRWAYENKKGTVSEPLEFGNKFVVAVLSDIKEKGVAPFDQVKEDLTAKVIKEKKAEMFVSEFNTALGAGTPIDALATKMKLNLEQAKQINFNTTSIPGAGNQPALIGAVSALKAKATSKPLVGKDGVYVVYVEAVTEAPVQKDFKAQQEAALMQLQPRVDYEVYDALKTNANITERLFTFY
ncbi:MAG: SurA N-terminal domain-containing protein [Bacteroidota bacterium]|nr:SurA N-terminal domain-containing protein [Bacteroidota bacterium]